MLVEEIKNFSNFLKENIDINIDDFATPIGDEEKKLANLIFSKKDFKNSKEKGDYLENLIKRLFSTLEFASNFNITHKESDIGQIDFYSDMYLEKIRKTFDIDYFINLGVLSKGLIGECKNYDKTLGRPIIEQACWRVCKSKKSLMIISYKFASPAIKEIEFFNNHHFTKHVNSPICSSDSIPLAIIPLDFNIINECIQNNIRFSTLLFFLIKQVQEGRINNILNL